MEKKILLLPWLILGCFTFYTIYQTIGGKRDLKMYYGIVTLILFSINFYFISSRLFDLNLTYSELGKPFSFQRFLRRLFFGMIALAPIVFGGIMIPIFFFEEKTISIIFVIFSIFIMIPLLLFKDMVFDKQKS